MTSKVSFKHNRDIGGIYEVESDGTDLKFFDMVKVRKTGKYVQGKEILLINVTPYGYVNFEGRSKFSCMMGLEALFKDVLFGYKVEPFDVEKDRCFLAMKYSRRYINGSHTPLETEDQHIARAYPIYTEFLKMSKGLLNKYTYFFVGDDHQMVKPLNFKGYYYFLAMCLHELTGRTWRLEERKNILESFFGSHAQNIDDKREEYLEAAECLGVEAKIEDAPCEYNSLEEIQKKVRSRIYLYFEVIKYFFKNGCKFTDSDHKGIDNRSYNVRTIYSALGGKICLKPEEEADDDIIAYFTALRVDKEYLPILLHDTTNESVKNVLIKRFESGV